MKVRDRADRLTAVGGTALFVVHDDPERIRQQLLADVEPPPFPILVDQEREAYATWGLGRAPWRRVWLDPQVWRQYARLIASGHRIHGTGADTRQLGGDFIVGPDGTIAYSRPQRRDDRPPVGELITMIERLADGSA